MLETKELYYVFPDNTVGLNDISLQLPTSSRTLLIGANGAGKSTLLRILAGKTLAKAGQVLVDDRDPFRDGLQNATYLGTEWAANPTVRRDMPVTLLLASVGGDAFADRRDQLVDILDIDLTWRMNRVSDGERRRVQLCMGLMKPWTTLFLDEVTVDLDVLVRQRLLDFLRNETEIRDCQIVYATHIFDGLMGWPTHVAHLHLGQVVEVGPVQEVLDRYDPSGPNSALLEVALQWLKEDLKARGQRQRRTWQAVQDSVKASLDHGDNFDRYFKATRNGRSAAYNRASAIQFDRGSADISETNQFTKFSTDHVETSGTGSSYSPDRVGDDEARDQLGKANVILPTRFTMDIVLEAMDTFVFDRVYATLLPASGLPSNATLNSSSRHVYGVAPPTVFQPSAYATSSLLARSNPLRQGISFFFITSIFGAILYLSTAYLNYRFIFDHENFKHPRYLKNQIQLEIKQALSAIPVMTLLTVPWFVAETQGFSRLYFSPSDHGWWYMALQFPLFLMFTDMLVYAIHRGLHHPVLYKRLHKPHHKWLVPTPFASHAFHPVDGYLQSTPYHLFPFVFPLQKLSYVLLFVVVNVWTVMIHDGEYLANDPIINGSACHTIHHLYFNYNYGQYTTLWDRLGGTHRVPDAELFNPQKKMASKTWAKQIEKLDEIRAEVEGDGDDRVYTSGAKKV